ncbi:hypothetical protein ACS127_03635 [Amphibacillus sp. Q70]|uniref:hypothetical protein n=1 Tax=Amphibacillus sp. Q70 TaxID=3453416 RepID=UPI003F859778
MKRIGFILGIIIALQTLTGCSLIEKLSDDDNELNLMLQQDIGQGTLELVTPTITTADDEVEIRVNGVDEDKITFISVANETIYEDTIKNDTIYTLAIDDIEYALRTDYKPKVRLIQTSNNRESGDVTTFKQVRYTVEQE